MGVDVEMRIGGPASSELIEAFRDRFHNPYYEGDKYPYIDTDGVVHTLSRYYGPGYARGHWPWLREIIVWFRERGEEVHYGSDADMNYTALGCPQEWPPLVTDQFIADCDAYWETVPKDEDGYREGQYIIGPVKPEHLAAAHAERYPPTDVTTP